MISFTLLPVGPLRQILLKNNATVEVDVYGKPIVKLLAREIGLINF